MINDNHVTAALDLSRVHYNTNPLVARTLKKSILIGQEIELLESIRTQDNPNNDFFYVTFDEIGIKAYHLGIDINLLDDVIIPKLNDADFFDIIDKDTVEIKFQNTKKIYDYGKLQIKGLNSDEKSILNLLADGMIKPVPQERLDGVISIFPEMSQDPLKKFLMKTEIMSPITVKNNTYYSSPKIYKNESQFKSLLSNSTYDSVSDILEYLNENPGVPIRGLDPRIYNPNIINGLTLAGAIDPIELSIKGSSTEYLVPSNLNSDRYDQDHLDLVKKTLANFRFGENYAKWKLNDLTRFLESLLDRGYAGNATPIGTDYKNLELAGIVRVSPVSGDKHRFWMQKKDVIQDTLNVLKGSASVIKNNPNTQLQQMRNSVVSRMILSNNKNDTISDVTNALRKVQRGIN
jgi:hypothetical protein